MWDTALLDELAQCMRDASICGWAKRPNRHEVVRYFPNCSRAQASGGGVGKRYEYEP